MVALIFGLLAALVLFWAVGAHNRLVLIFDIWRPELDASEQAQITALFDAVDQYK